jgi:hypothetical protein
MLMMGVGVMRMAVAQQRVRVLVSMRFSAVPIEIVGMLVVLVVDVAMRMPDRQMRMRVLMPFPQM